MRLHEQPLARMNLVASYGPGGIHINGHCLTAPLVVAPGFLQQDWIASIGQLTPDALDPVWQQQPQVVLLGSDDRPAGTLKSLRGPFAGRRIALEVMDLGAACRTYNVLAQEDRSVVALLFP
jgi:uncharacterized protein